MTERKLVPMPRFIFLSVFLVVACGNPAHQGRSGPDIIAPLEHYSGLRFVEPDAGLRMRAEANTKARVITLIAGGEQVTVLRTKEPAVTIAGNTNYWARIAYKGKTGWVFGGFLREYDPAAGDFDKIHHVRYESRPSPELRRALNELLATLANRSPINFQQLLAERIHFQESGKDYSMRRSRLARTLLPDQAPSAPAPGTGHDDPANVVRDAALYYRAALFDRALLRSRFKIRASSAADLLNKDPGISIRAFESKKADADGFLAGARITINNVNGGAILNLGFKREQNHLVAARIRIELQSDCAGQAEQRTCKGRVVFGE